MATISKGSMFKTKCLCICLSVVLISAGVILIVDFEYAWAYPNIPEQMKNFYHTRLQNITSVMSLADKVEKYEQREQTADEVSSDLKTLDQLISEYNEVAENSNGALEKYEGKSNSFLFLSWALKKVVGNALSQTGYLQGLISRIPGLKGTTLNENLKTNADTSSPTENTLKTVSRSPDVKRRLLLFSTWVDVPEKRQAQENVLRTWRLWQPLITPLVFTNDPKIQKQAKEYGWEVLKEPKTACGGVPIFREMFRMVIKNYNSSLYGFVNSDILLGKGLLSTMEALASNKTLMGDSLMAVVRRINVNFKTRAPVHHVDNLTQIAHEGRPMTDGSSDGIFTNRHFPWDHVPDVVPGRLGIAMWMVSYGRDMGSKVIDISKTVTAVHMLATKAGNRESWGHKLPRCNHAIFNSMKIKPQTWFCGKIHCAPFETVSVNNTGHSVIQVIDKTKRNHPRCGECNMDLTPLINRVF